MMHLIWSDHGNIAIAYHGNIATKKDWSWDYALLLSNDFKVFYLRQHGQVPGKLLSASLILFLI